MENCDFKTRSMDFYASGPTMYRLVFQDDKTHDIVFYVGHLKDRWNVEEWRMQLPDGFTLSRAFSEWIWDALQIELQTDCQE